MWSSSISRCAIYITFDLIVIQSQRVIWNFQNLISHISLLINDLKNPFRITKSNIRSDKFFQETDFDFIKSIFDDPWRAHFNSILTSKYDYNLITFGYIWFSWCATVKQLRDHTIVRMM